MKTLTLLFAAVMLLPVVALAQLRPTGEDNTPAIGATAPDYGLDGLRGEKKVLLAFFPAAFTPG